jgi:hypothetical protein
MWYVEKYRADDKKPYLMARVEDFADLQKMVSNRRHDRVEIVAPMDVRAAEVKKLRALGSVHVQTSK